MTIRKITERIEYRAAKKIYRKSFPRVERAPFHILKRRAQKGFADFQCIYDEDKIVGFFYLLRLRDMAYLFYLAVDESERGKGYGRYAIQMIRELYSDCRIFLALEQLDEAAENYQQRVKRHMFYESCGLTDLSFHIIEGPVEFAAMGNNCKIKAEEYRELILHYMGGKIPKGLEMRLIER